MIVLSKNAIKRLCCLSFIALLILSRAEHATAEGQTNIIIIFTDDQGYGDLGCFGSKTIRTPNIDRMAREGCKLTSFLVASSVCSPSRAALLTGSYPKRTSANASIANRSGPSPD